MASEDVQTNLRLPADLKDRLVASAAENNRSLSAEVASRLDLTFNPADAPATGRQVLELFKKLRERDEHASMNVTLMRDMFAIYLQRLYEMLGPEDQADPSNKHMYELASAVVRNNADLIRQAFEGFVDLHGGANVKPDDFYRKIAADNAAEGDKRSRYVERFLPKPKTDDS